MFSLTMLDIYCKHSHYAYHIRCRRLLLLLMVTPTLSGVTYRTYIVNSIVTELHNTPNVQTPNSNYDFILHRKL